MTSKKYFKEWRKRNKEKLAKYAREYYLKNKDRISAYNRKWQEKLRRKSGIKTKDELRKILSAESKLKYTCPSCGGRKSRIEYTECFLCSRKNQLSGENNPLWNGGYTSFRKSLYATRKYKDWRNFVFNRDNYICQSCGKRGGNLEAHHIKRMIVIIREIVPNYLSLKGYEVRDKLLEDSNLWDVSNGITLCRLCHKKECKKDKEEIAKYN